MLKCSQGISVPSGVPGIVLRRLTGIKGAALYHPIRIALTGSHSGPDFDKLIPIIEEGSTLGIGVPSIQQRVERFVGV